MKKRDCQTGIEISDTNWQRFEKFLPEPEALSDGGQKPTHPIGLARGKGFNLSTQEESN